MNHSPMRILGWMMAAWILATGVGYAGADNPYAQLKIDLIENPEPSHEASRVRMLHLVKVISPDLDEDHFLGRVDQIQVDSSGNVYVYDSVMETIIKLNANHRFERTIGKAGEGPGEFKTMAHSSKNFRIQGGEAIYLQDKLSHKMIVYDLEGEFVEEWRYPRRAVLFPLKLGKGRWLAHTAFTFDLIDKNIQNRIKMLLTVKELTRVVISGLESPGFLHMNNLLVDVFDEDRFGAVYPTNGRFYLFDQDRRIRDFLMLPRRWIEGMKAVAARHRRERGYSEIYQEKGGKRYYMSGTWRDFIQEFFVDRDREESFYVAGGASSEKIQNPLYRFNTRGRLLGARGYPVGDSPAGDLYLTYHCKQKGIIYASDEDTIYLFREEDK